MRIGDMPLPPEPDPSTVSQLIAMLNENEMHCDALSDLFREFGHVVRLKASGAAADPTAVGEYVLTVGPAGNRVLTTSAAARWVPTVDTTFPTLDGRLPEWPSLSFLDGERHRRHRRLILQAFDRPHLAGYALMTADVVRRRAGTWWRQIDLFAEMTELALEILARTMFGIIPGSADYECFAESFPIVALRSDSTLAMSAAHGRLRQTFENMIRERRREPTGDALSVLASLSGMAEPHELTEEDALDYAYMLADFGHADIALMATYVLAALSCRPDLYALIRDEQANCRVTDTVSGARVFPVTVSIIREVERLYPPVTSIRRQMAYPVALSGYQIPAGATLVSSIYLTHRLPSLFAQPDVFDPARFLPPRDEHRTPFGLMGFGAGPRKCIAYSYTQTVITVLVHLLTAHFRFQPISYDSPPPVDYTGSAQRPASQICCKLCEA